MRNAIIERKTKETDIKLSLELDGDGASKVNVGIGFLEHMLTLLSYHSKFTLDLFCKGDLNVDCHHSTEDVGIALGCAVKQALGDKVGINRYASIMLPMDESLVMVAVDVSGRGAYFGDLKIESKKIGCFDTELIDEFFTAFAINSGITLHVRTIVGKNSHHIAEAAFKGLGRVLKEAFKIVGSEVPSTKGAL